MDTAFIERIRVLCDRAGGQNALARRLGMSLGAVQRYLRGGEPTRQVLIRICETCAVSLDWLVYGREAGGAPADAAPAPASSALPLYGLAEGGAQQGWYAPRPYGTGASLECADPEAFAIMAADRSLAPEGILPGHLCVVSPHTPPRAGDAIFIRRTDGMAGLRKFLKAEAAWLHTAGWSDPGDGCAPVLTHEQLASGSVAQTGTIVLVRRRI